MRLLLVFLASAALAAAPDFAEVYRLLDGRCVECHAVDDAEGNLVLETYEGLMKGGDEGQSVVPGNSAESRLIRYVRGEIIKDGKPRFMPPGRREKLSADEVTLLARWIDAGALPAQAPLARKELAVPKIAPRVAVRAAVNALAYSPQARVLAAGRYGVVELLDPATRAVVRTLEGHKGAVNALVFSPDGATLYSASGENAIEGEIKVWSVPGGTLVRTLTAHRDTIYALALSPDGRTLASGSYDQQIRLWDTATLTERKILRGHNGAVFALAFRPDGLILASASADRTIKLWDAATGGRRDTLVQPLKEQVALAWSPDGQRLAAAGFDHRIRVWEVTPEAKETANPLLVARYAHEQPLTRLVWAGDTLVSAAQDGLIKLWSGAEIKERGVLEKQPDWPSALAFAGEALVAGRLDGTLACYALADGRPLAAAPPAAKPAAVSSLSVRAIQRGGPREITVRGTNLAGLKFVAASDPAVRVLFTDGANADEARLTISTSETMPRGSIDLHFVGAEAKHAGTLKLDIDDLPVVSGVEARAAGLKFPVSVWSTIEKPGESERFEFAAAAGQTLVFDLAAKSVGSKADAVLALVDRDGHVLASSYDFDATGDPFIAHTFREAGRFAVVVSDLQMGGSPGHFYRLSAGELPFVTACFPLAVPAHAESEIELIGHNLPPGARVKIQAGAAGELAVPLAGQWFRARRPFKVAVSDWPHATENAPTNTAPVSFNGRLAQAGEVDVVRFFAKAGSRWAIEAEAARRGSPVDTRLEVRDAQGRKIERLLLQAVRDSAINFRPIDSVTPDVRVENWREMELNQFMYLNGEVAKIFRMPEGPDSGFQFYTNAGKRLAYFDTTATAHALDEPAFIVEPHPPGARLVANGLPVFPLHYENDDDGERELGTDSRLLFTAPADGEYHVRISDSRGHGGPRHVYRVIIREARPDFRVVIGGGGKAINARSGQAFSVNANRIDGYDEPITVEITGVPAGFKVTSPLVVESGHTQAEGSLFALADARAEADWSGAQFTANGRAPQPFPKPTLTKEPPVWVALEPVAPGDTLEKLSPPTPMREPDAARLDEITIAPGEIVPAWIKIRRNGAKEAIRFDVENLPHGVIVDNLGLNGITLLPEQSEGEIHLKAEPWVQEMERLIYAKTRGFGEQTSLPVLLKVRKSTGPVRVLTVK
jgi:WD40 repeat protein